jgi:hypothetical protein
MSAGCNALKKGEAVRVCTKKIKKHSSAFAEQKNTQASTFLEANEKVFNLPLNRVHPDPKQPRKHFKSIPELAESILKNGLMQPISVKTTRR